MKTMILGGRTLGDIINSKLKVEDMKDVLSNMTSAELREAFPGVSELLSGDFNPDLLKLNVYDKLPSGLVVSRELMQGKEKNPTVGLIVPGKYSFFTGDYSETMTLLQGEMNAGVSFDQGWAPSSALDKHKGVTAPAGTNLVLSVEKNVLYVCQYEPQPAAKASLPH